MKRITIIALVLIFCRCTKEAKVKLPEVKSVPVVNCFISPDDSIIRVSLTKSKPLFEIQTSNDFDPITDAVVKISSVNGTVMLTYNSLNEIYEAANSASFVFPGLKYTLSIETAEGKTAKAETTVPFTSSFISSVSYERIMGIDNQPYDRYRVGVNDDGSVANYYRLGYEGIVRQPNGDTTFTQIVFDQLFTDANWNGGVTERQADLYVYPSQPFGDSLIGRSFYILNSDQHYYRFHESLIRYSNSNGNPFAEPTLIYTNVEGGLGIFASFSTSSPFRKFY